MPWRVQVWALACKSAVYERRRWRVNLNIVLVPLVVCVILYVLQRAINSQIVNDPLNKVRRWHAVLKPGDAGWTS